MGGGAARIHYLDLWGSRADKYKWLLEHALAATPWQELSPQTPLYLFIPQDTELLAEVYLAMTRGQESLLGEEVAGHEDHTELASGESIRLAVRVVQASEDELALHVQQLADIDKASKGSCLWKQLELGA